MQFKKGKPAPGIFVDSDFQTIDTVLAIALVYGIQSKNECRVATISMSRTSLPTASYLDVVERFYHGPAGNFSQLPAIGMPDRGKPLVIPAAYEAPLKKTKADGSPAYRLSVTRMVDTADPVTLIRNYLEAQYDGNAVFVLAGPATNLASALDFRNLKPLAESKLKFTVFATGPANANVRGDLGAARRFFNEWPTPIVVAPEELGSALPFPGASIDKEFAATSPDHPVADAYRATKATPYDAPSWAMTAALYAARPNAGYFNLSDPCTFTVKDDGSLAFTPRTDGKHHSLVLDPAQKEKILADYVALASAKPVQRRLLEKAADQKAADQNADEMPNAEAAVK